MTRKLSILVVDDEATLRVLAEIQLTHAGHTAACATNGREAVTMALAATTPYDVILMDLRMPVMDGHEAMRQLQAAPATCFIPIVCVSGESLGLDEARAQGRAQAYISKPYSRQQLLDALDEALAARGRSACDERVD